MRRLKILCYGDCWNDRISQGINYLKLMEPYGPVTLIYPDNVFNADGNGGIDQSLITDYDVLLLPGGADVDPARYHERPRGAMRANPHYEWLDTVFLPIWLNSGKPVIGICRGIQTLNVALGGSLFQDIKYHVGGANRGEECHELYTDIEGDGDEDYRIYGVNSYHHQAIKRLADGFNILGWSQAWKGCPTLHPRLREDLYVKYKYNLEKKFKLDAGHIVRSEKAYYHFIEVIKHRERPYIAFQYHPEDMQCPLAHKLITQTLIEHFGE